MKKQRTKGIVLVVVCFICVMCICSGFHKAQSEELSEIPDAVNSTRFNTTEHLTVVANQEEIADKEELAKQIIKMCRENSFQSIKFSYDMVCPTELQISVYKTEKDLTVIDGTGYSHSTRGRIRIYFFGIFAMWRLRAEHGEEKHNKKWKAVLLLPLFYI